MQILWSLTQRTEYSRRFKDIISEARSLIKNGIKEITLLGQNVNAYSDDGKKLSELIYELNEMNDLKRSGIPHSSKRHDLRFN